MCQQHWRPRKDHGEYIDSHDTISRQTLGWSNSLVSFQLPSVWWSNAAFGSNEEANRKASHLVHVILLA